MLRSDCQYKFIEDHAELAAVQNGGGDVIVVAAEILHERMSGGEYPRRAVPFQAWHRPQPGLQPS